ncbi:MAG TPA: RNA 2',3'-cyclic phosphodiesterase [Dissulfurispiraceae bacterium]|nr:RNA 2',3'-cyclic phosphodiesterase [Dissulfurispiraceae bacterium]
MRCFIAIDLSDEVRHAVADCIQQLKPLSRDIRWVPRDNLHLTLKFLGEISDAQAQEIGRALQEPAVSFTPFSLEVSGTGVFPNPRRPNILWIGIKHSSELARLQCCAEQTALHFGFAPESRLFSPHLTIGRVKGLRGVDAALSHFRTFRNAFFGSICVHEIRLMQSILSPSGATYATVCRCQLG